MILEEYLVKQKENLERVIEKANRILEQTKDNGRLIVTERNKSYYYYIGKSNLEYPGKIKKTFIKKEDIAVARQMANRDYAKQVISHAQRELHGIENLLDIYKDGTANDCYNSLHPGRKCLVTPLVLTDDEYSQMWLLKRTHIKNPFPITYPILTEKNEIVRSKSEKIIADKFNLMGIPYKYEEAIEIQGEYRFPDFTVLNKKKRKIYYWEHLGMLDKPDYLEAAMDKLDLYRNNNIIVGKNLIITYESSKQPLSVKTVELLIKENLIN